MFLFYKSRVGLVPYRKRDAMKAQVILFCTVALVVFGTICFHIPLFGARAKYG